MMKAQDLPDLIEQTRLWIDDQPCSRVFLKGRVCHFQYPFQFGSKSFLPRMKSEIIVALMKVNIPTVSPVT
jgi:hypothetical protein